MLHRAQHVGPILGQHSGSSAQHWVIFMVGCSWVLVSYFSSLYSGRRCGMSRSGGADGSQMGQCSTGQPNAGPAPLLGLYSADRLTKHSHQCQPAKLYLTVHLTDSIGQTLGKRIKLWGVKAQNWSGVGLTYTNKTLYLKWLPHIIVIVYSPN